MQKNNHWQEVQLKQQATKQFQFSTVICLQKQHGYGVWILMNALPELFGRDFLSKVQIILTDQDLQCIQMLDVQIKTGIFLNAKRRFCALHKIDRGLVVKMGSFKKTTIDTDIGETAIAFLWEMRQNVLPGDELQFFKNQFLSWIN